MSQIFDLDMIKAVYGRYPARIKAARTAVGRPLTLTEKILYTHLWDGETKTVFGRGKDYADFAPDRVAMQDATAQMALHQFSTTCREEVAVPTTVHCNHRKRARIGTRQDLQDVVDKRNEVFNFLESISNKYGIGFWKPGAGSFHQVLMEHYAFPGGMMMSTDSHAVNVGGLGMIAIDAGGTDACDVMNGLAWELKWSKLIGVKLTGKLSDRASAKDVIRKVADVLNVKVGSSAIVEYFGPGAASMSSTIKGTMAIMGSEIGVTTSIFGYDDAMSRYLKETGRAEVALLADDIREHLEGDVEVYANPDRYFDQVIEIDLPRLKQGASKKSGAKRGPVGAERIVYLGNADEREVRMHDQLPKRSTRLDARNGERNGFWEKALGYVGMAGTKWTDHLLVGTVATVAFAAQVPPAAIGILIAISLYRMR